MTGITDEAVEAFRAEAKDCTGRELSAELVHRCLTRAIPHLSQGAARVKPLEWLREQLEQVVLKAKNEGYVDEAVHADWLREKLTEAADLASHTHAPSPAPVGVTGRKFNLGDRVTKTKGSSWTGIVVGFYSTSLTPIGYAIESENEPGSVQIYPESALALTVPTPTLIEQLSDEAFFADRSNENPNVGKLASHEPAPTDTQEGVSEAGEVVAWRNWNQLHECYYLDEAPRGTLKVHDEKNEPLVRLSALTACQQEVERLRDERKVMVHEVAYRHAVARAETAEARILELEADLEVGNDKLRRFTDALTPSTETKAAYMGEFHMGITLMHNGDEDHRRVMIPWTTIKEIMAAIRARAVLGGQGNE